MGFLSGVRQNLARLILPPRPYSHALMMRERWALAPNEPQNKLSSIGPRDVSTVRSRLLTVRREILNGATESWPLSAIGRPFVLEKVWVRAVTATRLVSGLGVRFVYAAGPEERRDHRVGGHPMIEANHFGDMLTPLDDAALAWGGSLDVGAVCHVRGMTLWAEVANSSGGGLDVLILAQVSYFSETREAF